MGSNKSLVKLAGLLLSIAIAMTYFVGWSATDFTPKDVNKVSLQSNRTIQIKKPARKYAILVCGSTEKQFENKTIKAYNSLKELGYKDEDIECLMPTDKKGYVDSISNKLSVKKAFNNLSSKITKDDTLFFYFADHGNLKNDESILHIKDGTISESELKNLRKKLKCQYAIFIIEACYSGGFSQSMGEGNNIVLATSRKDKKGLFFSKFTDILIESFSKQEKLADKDKNGKVSLEEAIDYAALNDEFTKMGNLKIKRFLPLLSLPRQCPQLQYQDVKPSEIYPD